MLEGKFVSRKIRFFYEQCQPFPAIFQISLGVKKVYPDAPHTLNLPVREPLRVDDQTRHERLEVETFGAASGLCPEGATMMTIRLPTRHDYWAALKKRDVTAYRAEKKRIVQEVIAVLNQRFPGAGCGHRAVGYRDAGDFCPLHRQLAGQLRRLAADAAHPGAAHPLHAPGPEEFLHGRPLGCCRRRLALLRAGGPLRGADDLRAVREKVRGESPVVQAFHHAKA